MNFAYTGLDKTLEHVLVKYQSVTKKLKRNGETCVHVMILIIG